MASGDRVGALRTAIAELGPELVLDLSDEPILGYRERMERRRGRRRAPVRGPDFRLDPPEQGPPLPVPTLAVIGTGKRTGKTAIAGSVARLAARRGLEPVVVAMGRGGPPEPTLARAGTVDLDRSGRPRRRGAARGLGLPGGRGARPA